MSISHNIVVKIFREIYNLSTVLPLYSPEAKILDRIAFKYDVPRRVIYSIRNLSRIQHEILYPKLTHANETKIDKRIDDICKVIDNKYAIRKIFREINLPAKNVAQYLIIKLGNKDNLIKIISDFNQNEKISAQRAKDFEIKVEKELNNKNINFKNEQQLKLDGITDATPDVLLVEPVKINFNNKIHELKWLDAKNYFFCNVGFIKKSLKKQAKKYNDKYGPGCFVFSYGYDKELSEKFYVENNTLIISFNDLELI